jgi:hypothetical protein
MIITLIEAKETYRIVIVTPDHGPKHWAVMDDTLAVAWYPGCGYPGFLSHHIAINNDSAHPKCCINKSCEYIHEGTSYCDGRYTNLHGSKADIVDQLEQEWWKFNRQFPINPETGRR